MWLKIIRGSRRNNKFYFFNPKSDKVVGFWYGNTFRTYSINGIESGYEELRVDKNIVDKIFHI